MIFAQDAHAAVSELGRITASDGRIAIFQASQLRSKALASAVGHSAGAPPFAWHEHEALEGLFAAQGFSISMREHHLDFVSSSPAQFVEDEFRDHPMWVAAHTTLEARGGAQALRERALEIFDSANEQPGAFAVRSRYVVIHARRV